MGDRCPRASRGGAAAQNGGRGAELAAGILPSAVIRHEGPPGALRRRPPVYGGACTATGRRTSLPLREASHQLANVARRPPAAPPGMKKVLHHSALSSSAVRGRDKKRLMGPSRSRLVGERGPGRWAPCQGAGQPISGDTPAEFAWGTSSWPGF